VFVGDELQATLLNGSKIAYRMRTDEVIEFMGRRVNGESAVGVLTKDPSRR
jgi:hypothetical protein